MSQAPIVEITPKQTLAIEALLAGATDTDAATAADVRRETLYRWKTRDVIFIAEVNRRKRERWEAAQGRAQQMVDDAVRVMHESLNCPELSVGQRLAAAERVLRAFGGAEALGRSLGPGVGAVTPEGVAADLARRDREDELSRARDAALDAITEDLDKSIVGLRRS